MTTRRDVDDDAGAPTCELICRRRCRHPVRFHGGRPSTVSAVDGLVSSSSVLRHAASRDSREMTPVVPAPHPRTVDPTGRRRSPSTSRGLAERRAPGDLRVDRRLHLSATS